jgi:hypothetical protein
MTSRIRRPQKVTTFLALLVFLGAFAEASYVHTDDGCPVELHCLACRLTLGTLAVAPPPVISPAAILIDLGAPALAPPQPLVESAPKTVAPRGPPLA